MRLFRRTVFLHSKLRTTVYLPSLASIQAKTATFLRIKNQHFEIRIEEKEAAVGDNYGRTVPSRRKRQTTLRERSRILLICSLEFLRDGHTGR